MVKNKMVWNKGRRFSLNYRTANCLNCKKEFEYFLNHTAGKFCSHNCYKKSIEIPKKECIICKKLYTPYSGTNGKSTIKEWRASKYCSIDCANKGKIKGKFINCSYCKTTIWRTPYSLKNTKKPYCSKRCFNLSKKGKIMTSNYKKGYRAEREVMFELKNKGYQTIRNFLSWGVFDICAIGLNHLRYIQVKNVKKKYPLSAFKKDIEQMIAFCVPDFATKELWVKTDYQGWEKYFITDNSIRRLNEEEDLRNLTKLSENSEIIISESPSYLGQRRVNDFITVINQKEKTIQFIQLIKKKLNGSALKRLYDTLPPDDEYLVKSLIVKDIREFKKLFNELIRVSAQ